MQSIFNILITWNKHWAKIKIINIHYPNFNLNNNFSLNNHPHVNRTPIHAQPPVPPLPLILSEIPALINLPITLQQALPLNHN